jgi:CRP-like cAMP-binding protein
MLQTKITGPWAVTPELFEGLPDSICGNIRQAGVQKSVPAGTEIFRDGEPNDSVSLLLEGLVKVSRVDANGNEAILWLNTPGQFIGSLCLAPGSSHASTAITLQPCKVVTWSLPAFEMILERFPEVTRVVEQIIARQTADLSSRVCEVSTAPFWIRLARTLVRLADQMSRRVNSHIEIDITQEMLAQLTGSTLFNVNHQLSWWEHQGLVARRRCLVVVMDMAGLKKLCGIMR